jgi:hypothetical protein
MSDIQVTSVDGSQINVSTGTVVGPLPSLQLAAGSGINISNAGGVSTISANLAIPANLADLGDVSTSSLTLGQALTWNGTQWAGANIPVGTTVNGLFGAVALVAGDGINVTQDGQNITLASSVNTSNYATTSYVDEQLAGFTQSQPFVRDLTLIQTLDGTQHFAWSANDGYSQGYLLEVQQVNVTQNLDNASTITTNPDGSLNITVEMDTSTIGFAYALSDSNTTDNLWDELIFENFQVSNEAVQIYGIYLPDTFSSPGTYPVFSSFGDIIGNHIGDTPVENITFSAHGSPVAPEIVSKGTDGMNVTAIVESVQTPHQLGWYDLGNITYYLEINENASATTGWTRGGGVTSPNPVQMLSTAAPSNATWYVRAVAANPLGEGDPGEVV